MASESPPAKQPRARPSPRATGSGEPPPRSIRLALVDGLLIAAFLALTFLLGVFPLKDTDFWWHLKTGDLIRATGAVPTVDTYTFTSEGKPWTDLHWGFQVAISWLYARGGVPALTLAKCVVTCVAILILLTARRPEWPVWAMLLAWLPAILVLAGRMYVRPETLTLLYLAIFLAVLMRIERTPALALVLPIVQVMWVNSHGLFVLGPIVLVFALLDAAHRQGVFATVGIGWWCLVAVILAGLVWLAIPDNFRRALVISGGIVSGLALLRGVARGRGANASGRKGWWQTVGLATVLTGLACLVNPYGIHGALYPLQLARTMSTPIFSRDIAELTPIPLFIQRDGLVSLPLRLHLLALLIGALSFLVPLGWLLCTWLRPVGAAEPAKPGLPVQAEKGKAKSAKPAKRASRSAAPPAPAPLWRLSLFRLLLFAAFSVLSWQATRNSHQFAAVVGTVTAWNLGEWAAAVRRRAWQKAPREPSRPGAGLIPRFATLLAIAVMFGWVASGRFYELAAEGRTIGLDEQPLWYPHEAVKFSGTPGMPPRFLAFHIGHPSLYEYYFGPERKVYADARLEIIGSDLFERYMDLQKRIIDNDRGWSRALDDMGRPVVLIDLEGSAAVGGTLLTSPDWRLVWFDPVAAVFVHARYSDVVAQHEVDFAARHFQPEPRFDPRGNAALLASAKGLRNLVAVIPHAPHRARSLILLGSQYARRITQADPDRSDAWKLLAQFELFRDVPPGEEPIPRFRMPFDPVFDLSAVRLTYALRRTLDIAPDDFMPLMLLAEAYSARGMHEAAMPSLERLMTLTPINGKQAERQTFYRPRLAALRARIGPAPRTTWENRSQLNEQVNVLLNEGRAEAAAELLERGIPADGRAWEETDRIAVLRLHLGDPARARALWQSAPAPPRPAVRDARVAVTYLAEGSFDLARQSFRGAIAADPNLFEAHYGLSILEQDAGHASDALTSARKAASVAPTAVARTAAQGVVATVTPYASSGIAEGEKSTFLLGPGPHSADPGG